MEKVICHGVNLKIDNVGVSMDEVVDLSTVLHLPVFDMVYVHEVEGSSMERPQRIVILPSYAVYTHVSNSVWCLQILSY